MNKIASVKMDNLEKHPIIKTRVSLYSGVYKGNMENKLKCDNILFYSENYINRVADFCVRDRICCRIFMEDGRYLCLLIILGLHALECIDDRSTWVTLGRLQDVVCGYGIASKNRVAAIVAFLENYGFVERRQVNVDKRVWNIVPTPKMMSSDIEFLRIHHEILSTDPGATRRTFDLLPLSETYRLVCQTRLEHLDELMAIRGGSDEIRQMLQRDSGLLILLLLLGNGIGDKQRGYSELADLAGVSRTQARILVEECERLGLVSLHAKGGRRLALSARFSELASTFILQTAQFFDRVYEDASLRATFE